MASSTLVLPCPLSPEKTVKRGSSATSARSTLRNWRSASDSMRNGATGTVLLNAHRHDDGFVAVVVALGGGLDDRGIEIAADAEDDLFVVERAEDVEEVLRVESDDDLGSRVIDGNFVEAVARFRALAGDAHRAGGDLELHAAGAIACGERDGPKGVRESGARQANGAVARLRDDLRVRRKLRVDELDREERPADRKKCVGSALVDRHLLR